MSWRDITYENQANAYFANPPGDESPGFYDYYFVNNDVVIEGSNAIYRGDDRWNLKSKHIGFLPSLAVDFSNPKKWLFIVLAFIALILIIK